MTYTQEQIFEKISGMLQELFEIPADKIKMESRLFEELGLDSIDAIDLITHLQGFVGQRISPEEFKSVRTVADIIRAAENLLKTIGNVSPQL